MAQDHHRGDRSNRRDDCELEQALTAAEDARDEAARLAQDLDQALKLLVERDRALELFQADAQRWETMARALISGKGNLRLVAHVDDRILAEELQVTVEELNAALEELQLTNEALERANQELGRANQELEQRVAERTAGLRRSEERFRDGLEIETVGVVFFTMDGSITEANEAFLGMCGFSREDIAATSLRRDTLIPPEWMADSERATVELREVGRTTPYEKECLRKDGSRWWGLFVARRIAYNENVEFVLDISDRKAGEHRQKLLLRELNHRVKNTLATVQAIASQTLHSSQSPEHFVETFQTRLQSLAQAHDLLTHTQWKAVPLNELVSLTLGPHGIRRVRVAGPPILIEPHVATSLHLAFHELATNAAKYGALSVSSGCVRVNWVVGDNPMPTLHIEWQESDGPPVSLPTRRGFGSRLIERGLTLEFGGEVALEFDRAGVRCRIDIPLSANVRPQLDSRSLQEA